VLIVIISIIQLLLVRYPWMLAMVRPITHYFKQCSIFFVQMQFLTNGLFYEEPCRFFKILSNTYYQKKKD